MTDEKKGLQCVLARYTEANDGSGHDLLMIKEKIHYHDGTIKANVRLLENYQRECYVTRETLRTYQQKKEWESLSRLKRIPTTQAKMSASLAKALFKKPTATMKELSRSPYVYGTDISTSSLIKHQYQSRWPDLFSPNELAVLEVRTEKTTGFETIVALTLVFKDQALIVTTEAFVGQQETLVEQVREQSKTLGELMVTVKVARTPFDALSDIMATIHQWQPDFVGLWGLEPAMNAMLQCIDKASGKPEDLFCDPRLPPKYRNFAWRPMATKKTRATGKTMNRRPQTLWHWAEHLASFCFVDMMALFALLRDGSNGQRASYALYDILQDELGLRRASPEAIAGYPDEDWERLMQSDYPAQYLLDSLHTGLALLELDRKNEDVSQKLTLLSGVSQLSDFASLPKRIADALHFFCLDQKKVVGSATASLSVSGDEHLMAAKGWILNLPPALRESKDSLRVIEENPWASSDVYAFVGNLDIKSCYPTSGIILNIARDTTRRELAKIKGLKEEEVKRVGLNLTNPTGNAVEIAQEAFGLPDLDTLLARYQAEKKGL